MKYKVGDKVLIKSKYDLDCTAENYPFLFTREMLARYAGKIMTIRSVEGPIIYSRAIPVSKSFKLTPDDFYKYRLKEDYWGFSWSSAMFNPHSDEI